ncbi:hypothetical protein BAE44_0013556 [Dichanthelium oligosanthes]|uniref:Disease resistance R13L4/SHOC-2-like LRR domain-containing protein n=1 Tax=Dichanthelium oligosanthes TaxID=888268 RepID=A0A1E5VJZ7_9POAL|nr:hypothetical protein BAE44_0013556 [Dichanthelium oligosanthes]
MGTVVELLQSALHLKALLDASRRVPGYLVEKDSLIWRWVAKGFVHHHQPHDYHRRAAAAAAADTGTVGSSSSSLYEIGESYLNELVNRGMIETSTQGRCLVHPIMLSLVRYFSSQEDFVIVMDRDRRHSCPYTRRRNTRCGCGYAPRLAMRTTTNIPNIDAAAAAVGKISNLNMGGVRSFDARTRRLSCVDVDDVPPQLLGSFQVFRLLALEHCRGGVGSEHLKQIEKLRHLRYLSLLGTPVIIAEDADELPETAGEEEEALGLGALRLLQTLDLRGTGIKALPTVVFELRRLMCLCVDGASVDGGNKWSEMRKLTSLEEVRLRCGSGDDTRSSLEHLAAVLDGLTEPQVVEISELDATTEGAAMDALARSLPRLKKIRRLALRYNGYDDLGPAASSGWVRIARSFSR